MAAVLVATFVCISCESSFFLDFEEGANFVTCPVCKAMVVTEGVSRKPYPDGKCSRCGRPYDAHYAGQCPK